MSATTVVPTTIASWPCSTTGVAPEVLDATRANAQAMLWALTGRRVGDLVTIGELYRVAPTAACWVPYLDDTGQWWNGRLGVAVVLLRSQPVRVVQEVRIGSGVVAPASYGLEAGMLVRYGGSVWPGVTPDQAPSLSIDYRHGLPGDGLPGYQQALEALACDLLSGVQGGACRLPSRVVSITRQGVTMDLATAEEFADKGLTGVAVVDSFIRTMNPKGLTRPCRIVSPDMPQVAR